MKDILYLRFSGNCGTLCAAWQTSHLYPSQCMKLDGGLYTRTPSPKKSRDKCKMFYFRWELLRSCNPILGETFWPYYTHEKMNENEVYSFLNHKQDLGKFILMQLFELAMNILSSMTCHDFSV